MFFEVAIVWAITAAIGFVASIVVWKLRWAVFLPDNRLPPILMRSHADWPVGLKWIPRRWFAWLGEGPTKIAGSATGNYDITAPGTWAVCFPLFLSFRFRNGWHGRIGFRWDYVDLYYQISAAFKRIR